MATYYVAGSGSDVGGNGSSGNPWRSLGKAYAQSVAGDTILVRNGTYNETLTLGKANQTWRADTGHTPVMDGRWHIGLMSGSGPITKSNTMPRIDSGNYLPGVGYTTPMIKLAAAGTTFQGFVVQNVGGSGCVLDANNTTVRGCVFYFCYGSGIFSNPSTKLSGLLIENNIVRLASAMTFDPTRKEGYSVKCSGQCVIGSIKVGDNVGNSIIRGNDVAWGFGEGINIGKKNDADLASAPIIVGDNVVHDINHTYLYINASRGVILRNNTCYCTNIALNLWDGDAPVGIRILDEVDEGYVSNLQIYNNLVVNLGYAFDWGDRKTKTTNTYVGHNTFVGGPQAPLKLTSSGAMMAGVYLAAALDGTNQKGIFENNIIDYSMVPNAPLNMSNAAGGDGITVRNNNWSSLPVARGRGAGDVNGNPQLVDADAPLSTTGYPGRTNTTWASVTAADNFDPDNYRPKSNSPGRGKASNGSAASGVTPPAALDEDYFGATRDASPAARDIGAIEFGGVVPNDVTADFTFTPASGVAPLAVQFTDASTADGAATITSRLWAFGDGNTSTATNPLHTYAAAGTYTPTLTVQDTGLGLSDLFTGAAITVGVAPQLVTADFEANVVSGDAPLTVAFEDQSTGTVASRLWQFGDGEESTETDPSHIYATAGTYTVSLAVVSPTGHSDVEEKVAYITATVPDDDDGGGDGGGDGWPELIIVGPLLALDGGGAVSATYWDAAEGKAGHLEIGHGAARHILRLINGTTTAGEEGISQLSVDADGNLIFTREDGTTAEVVLT